MPTKDSDPPSPGPRLLLMRHAKAAWPQEAADHARPLSPRGRVDALASGEWLVEVGWVPDLIVCSDALRTRQTAELVGQGLERQVPTTAAPSLYECGICDVLDTVHATQAQVSTLMVVGHEPTMSATTAVITGRQMHFPTTAVARIELDVRWDAAEGHSGELIGLWTPKD